MLFVFEIRFVSQSNNLKCSNKVCDWLILACFIREQCIPDATLLVWKIKYGLKLHPNTWGNYRILYHKTNKEASTVLCSVVKHARSGRTLRKQSETFDDVSCFFLHFFRALQLLVCLQQSRARSRLLYLLNIVPYCTVLYRVVPCYTLVYGFNSTRVLIGC